MLTMIQVGKMLERNFNRGLDDAEAIRATAEEICGVAGPGMAVVDEDGVLIVDSRATDHGTSIKVTVNDGAFSAFQRC